MLLIVSAAASPEWSDREQLIVHVRNRASFDTPQGRAIFALIPFGVIAGIPAALGLIPANAMVLLGALVACMVARAYLSRPERDDVGGWTPAHGWFLALAWSILAVPLHVNSMDLVDAVAAQTALGPAPLFFGPAGSAAMWVALLAGLLAASGWSQGQRKLSRPASPENDAVDAVSRWGESALAATAVSGVIFGPSLGALVAGPIDGRTLGIVSISFVVTMLAVAGVSYCRRFVGHPAQWGFAAGAAMLAMTAMMVAAFVR
ncbi:MAG TPA: hypothetical protein VHJ78_08225 [Actinomycetota bacterium]|nr:hypothetical protein [Actinomycetota bacterium]